MTLTFTILGCGSSGGVPRPALGWGACDPNNPKNRRRRCSLLVERVNERGGKTTVLIDTSPDLREQLLDADVNCARRRALYARSCRPHPRHRRPAAVLHPSPPPHRRLSRRADLALAACQIRLLLREPARQRISADRHRASPHRRRAGDHRGRGRRDYRITAQPSAWRYAVAWASGSAIWPIRRTSTACPTDSIKALAGLDLWIVDALRHKPHPSHFSLTDALGLDRAAQAQAKRS